VKLGGSVLQAMARAAVEMAASNQHAITVSPERCLHQRDRFAACDRCARACPVEALIVEGPGSITLDSAKCMKCGLCMHLCPLDAFCGDDGVANLLHCIVRAGQPENVELACAAHPLAEEGPTQSDVVLRTSTCLAALGPSAYLSLFTLGVKRVIIRKDFCSACSLSEVVATIEATVDQVKDLLAPNAPLGVSAVANAGDEWATRAVISVNTPLRSRRDFLRGFVVANAPATDIEALAAAEPTTAGKAPPRERRRSLFALEHLSPYLGTKPLDHVGFSRVQADESCTACGACARACPTGAIQLEVDEDNGYRLTFAAGDCTDCGVCFNVCEPQALYRDGAPVPAELLERLELRRGRLRQCQRCGARFEESLGGELCPLCVFRQEYRFGSRLPAAAQRRGQNKN